MWANFPGVEFLGTATKLKEREGKIILHVKNLNAQSEVQFLASAM